MPTPCRSRRPAWVLAVALVVSALAGETASAGPIYGFTDITHNSAADAATAGQYSVQVLAYNDSNIAQYVGADASTLNQHQVLFLFRNTAQAASSITDVYFQDGTLLDISKLYQSSGVNYSPIATPGNLPGGNSLTPPFVATKDFSADSNTPVMANGVNSSNEWLGVLFNLQNGYTYNDVLTALNNGLNSPGSIWDANGVHINGAPLGLRVGIHVQGFTDSGSESFVNGAPSIATPVPSTLVLALSSLVTFAVAGVRLRRRRSAGPAADALTPASAVR